MKLHAYVQMHEKKTILNKKHPTQGTGISVVVRENKLFIFYQKLSY